MSARYELEVTISSAKNLKNVNWRHGPLRPYAVVWVDPRNKCSTRVDEEGDESPVWDQTLVIPLTDPIEESTLYIDIVHADAPEDTKPLIGSAKLKLKDIVDDVGIGEVYADSVKLKRPSGRPHGKLELKVTVRESRYHAQDPYGVPPPPQYQPAPPPYGGYYPYSPYGGAPPQYGQPSSYAGYKEEEKKSKYGMGTGLAVGAAAGLLGGLAIAEGVDYVEDQIAEDAAQNVEEDLGYDIDDE